MVCRNPEPRLREGERWRVEDEVVVGHIETHQILQQGWGSGARGLPTGDVRVCVCIRSRVRGRGPGRHVH